MSATAAGFSCGLREGVVTLYTAALKRRQEVNWAEVELCRAQTTDDTDTDKGATQLTQQSMGKFNQTFLTFYQPGVVRTYWRFKKVLKNLFTKKEMR